MSETLRIGIVGYGKIAQDQHAPSIAANPRFELVATVSRSTDGAPGIPNFPTHTDMLAQVKDLDAVAVCTPPSVRYAIARDCIEAGLQTLLEKPPGVSLSEVEELARLAAQKPVTLFTTWHAQHNPPVEEAAALLKNQRIASMTIEWKEDVRKWHPGQAWVWEPGGFGVFDPGINAMSIATRIFPGALFVREAELLFPQNKQAPIAANLRFESPAADGPVTAAFDWRQQGGETWTIIVKTAGGDEIKLADGGARLFRNGEEKAAPGPGEYPSIYQEFAELIDSHTSHVDVAPLRLAADAFLLGRRTLVEAFED
ncbi:MAG TPA: Gfo/Idh/MocA family oxidoreductase [Allosphingosinicella sp.]|jgi:predicted dehydrogenase|nr:Gfo/Idh/MocA family oxidoreductase [Allosphingosinicella sp.]